jgi:hypothetical protein
MQPPAGLVQAGEGAAVTAESTFTQGSRACPDAILTTDGSPLLPRLVELTDLIASQGEQAAMQGPVADLESLPDETRDVETARVANLAKLLLSATRQVEELKR